MQMETLQRKLDGYARQDPTRFARMKIGTSLADIEAWRQRVGGVFGSRTGRRWFNTNAATRSEYRGEGFRRGKWMWEPTGDWAFDSNIVTNEGLAYIMDVGWREVADIAPWYIVLSTTNTTPLATHTYAVPGYTEATPTNLDETVRQAWVDGSPTGTTTRSVAGTAVTYTGDNSFTNYGAAMVGGGTAATTLEDVSGGGTLCASSLYGSSVAMVLDATVDVTYTVTGTDDGV